MLIRESSREKWYNYDYDFTPRGSFSLKGSADDESGFGSSLVEHPFGSDEGRVEKRVHRPVSLMKAWSPWIGQSWAGSGRVPNHEFCYPRCSFSGVAQCGLQASGPILVS